MNTLLNSKCFISWLLCRIGVNEGACCVSRWTRRRPCPCLWLRLTTAESRASTPRALSAHTSSCRARWWRYTHTHTHTHMHSHAGEQSCDLGPLTLCQVNGTEAEFAKKALFSRHPEMIDWPSDHDWFFAKFNVTQVAALLLSSHLCVLLCTSTLSTSFYCRLIHFPCSYLIWYLWLYLIFLLTLLSSGVGFGLLWRRKNRHSGGIFPCDSASKASLPPLMSRNMCNLTPKGFLFHGIKYVFFY